MQQLFSARHGIHAEVANSIRVIKTKKQTSEDVNCGYISAAQQIIASDWLGRGNLAHASQRG